MTLKDLKAASIELRKETTRPGAAVIGIESVTAASDHRFDGSLMSDPLDSRVVPPALFRYNPSVMHPKEIRWKQRFQNLKLAFAKLQEGVDIESPSSIEKQGIIKSFEFTFELSWKVLKDYLESRDVQVSFPRDVIKSAFQHGVIKDGELWMEMLGDRNFLAHTYDESRANEAYQKIKTRYFLRSTG